MPGRPVAGGTDYLGLAYLLLVLVVAFAPLLMGRREPPPESDDPGPGGGGGPPDRPPPPRGPTHGTPLPDAEPARIRLRDHVRLADRLPPRQRRRGAEPVPQRERIRV
jgi:hypothetical protein